MSKWGNCGNLNKLREFMELVRVAQTFQGCQLQFTVEHDPHTRERVSIDWKDLKGLTYNDVEILLYGKYMASWWDIISVAIVNKL